MFHLDEEQSRRVAAWQAELDARLLAKQRAEMQPAEFEQLTMGGKFPYKGAIGGGFTYCFTPTSLGVVVKVQSACGAELDVTDYDSW